jgi:ryanodine receptor 2
MYTPKPINTDDVTVSDGIKQLSELLAKNTHEIWASTRISEGWSYGEKRDDEKKLHPCLIPYDELPENEKDYDRHTSLETLRLIMKLGYRITKEDQ